MPQTETEFKLLGGSKAWLTVFYLFLDFRDFVYSYETWKMSEDAIDEVNAGLYYLDITLNLNEYRCAILGSKKNCQLNDVGANISPIGETLRSIFQEAIEDGLIEWNM